jgi:maltooligosyltrehalose trehalohydrolase
VRAPTCSTFGATLLGEDATRFRFWAPALEHVALEIEGSDPIAMRSLEDGWFEVEAACGPGAAFKFRVSPDITVPDPASRAVRGDAYGHSLVVDPRSYRWRNTNWRGRPWADAVFYELHVGAFGGFAGVKGFLPELVELGITAVELMPINAFPGKLNWGYDGVLPYAPSPAYGTLDELKDLIDTAHGLGLMMFLDVVYNHFGPEASFLDAYAPHFFREDKPSPWGHAIDFRRPQVKRFFTENAIYWLEEVRFDGLRFDAVHAIHHPDWLDETAAEVRARLEPDRAVHLVLENDDNIASHMRDGFFNAQWNDDIHHAFHVLLTGETDSYYSAYADSPALMLARCLAEGFAYQGQPSTNRGGKPRGTPSRDLQPSAFVTFLQNHDQIGNRALGERLTVLADPKALEAAIFVQLLCPQVPLIFMGEENASTTPFLFFAEHNDEIAQAMREGRKREFEHLAAAGDDLPDPNDAATFQRSIPEPDPARASERRAFYQRLLAIRRRYITPRLDETSSIGAQAIGKAAVAARWKLADGSILAIVCNLSKDPVICEAPRGDLVFQSSEGAHQELLSGHLPGYAALAVISERPAVKAAP